MKKINGRNGIIIIALILITLISLAYNINKKISQDKGTLLEDIQNAKAIAWIAPHNDDEIIGSGLIALASIGYKKDTYVITKDRKSDSNYPGNETDRLKDNQDYKDHLNLKGYIYAEDYIDNYKGNDQEKFSEFLNELRKTKGIDLIITFENTNGATGHQDHITWSRFLTSFAIKNDFKLYYLINKDPNVRYQGIAPSLDPIPITDIINLDQRITKDGLNISLWDLKVGVLDIYSSSQPGAQNIITHPEQLATFIHEENYRKVN